MKSQPIGIRFEDNEIALLQKYAASKDISFSEAVRSCAVKTAKDAFAPQYLSLSDVSNCQGDIALSFGQFLDDFNKAEDKYALIKDEPLWKREAGRWPYDLAAAAHKLAHDNEIPVPRWALKEEYISKVPLYAFGTNNKEFQRYLEKTTPREYVSHNLFLGENILQRA